MQLVPILSQPQLPADERVVALRVLNSQLANQVRRGAFGLSAHG
jgi:hypothetical protein